MTAKIVYNRDMLRERNAGFPAWKARHGSPEVYDESTSVKKVVSTF
jgi:hypothetical protein